MMIETAFNCGDRAWVFTGDRAQLLTIGHVRVEITDSPGIEQVGIQFDNFKPQSCRKEQYMCVETGIGSGSLYTLGEHIFATEAECLAANAERIEQVEAEKRRQEEWERRRLLREESDLRAKLARIEAIKEGAPA